MSKVDLHIHTTASDGRFTPAEIVRKAHEIGLQYIAITDHDAVGGVLPAREAARDFPELTLICGVEINTDISAGELHVLGYFVDAEDPELTFTLEKLRTSRVDRARKIVGKLNHLGVNINYERVRELAGAGAVGRPHIAQAMLEKGYISNFREAFNKYISRGGPAYVERDKVTPEDAVRLIMRAKGLPVLAHPLTFDNPEGLVSVLKGVGLVGLEAYYNNYSPEQVRMLVKMAEKYDLLTTGGSDFHGLDLNSEVMMGGAEVPLECAERLMAAAKKSK
jgi:predicted metal-dependent phosphoesterase TrpH